MSLRTSTFPDSPSSLRPFAPKFTRRPFGGRRLPHAGNLAVGELLEFLLTSNSQPLTISNLFNPLRKSPSRESTVLSALSNFRVGGVSLVPKSTAFNGLER